MRSLWWLVLAVGCGSEGQALKVDPDFQDDSGIIADEPELEGPVDDWPEDWSLFEEEVLRLVNIQRAAPQRCGNQNFGPGPALTPNFELRDAARAHSEDMGTRGFFAHTAPPPLRSQPSDRAARAGYPSRQVGENIAAGQRTPADVMDAWMNSPGHCSNIMGGDWVSLGVGLFYDRNSTPYWTQVFGTLP